MEHIWFKIFIGVGIFSILGEALRIIFREKFINSFNKVSDTKREKLRKHWSFSIKLCKLFFIIAPINLIVLPCLLYFYSSKDFLAITVVLSMFYIIIVEKFIFDSLVLKNLKPTNSGAEQGE